MKPVIAYLPLGLWAAGVLALGSLQPGPISLPVGTDKVAHFILYGVGGGIAAWTGRARGLRAGLGALGVVLLTGFVDELHQSTLAGRQADLFDWIADAVGAGLFYTVLHRLLPEKEISVS